MNCQCKDEKPALVEIARFLFRIGKQFVPPCKISTEGATPAPAASLGEPGLIEEIDEEIQKGLAQFDPINSRAMDTETTEAVEATTVLS